MSRISQKSVQEVIHRIDIVEVIGHFLQLKRRGANYITTCPFHNEKTPSFNVNPARGVFKCFGCGVGGDAISFIREYEKFSFVETIKWLAQFYQIELEEEEYSEEKKEQFAIEESLRTINSFALEFFKNNLWKEEEGQIIGGQYFKSRGFTDEIIQKFDLGYALDAWEHFYNAAIEQGYQKELLVKSGLVRNKENKFYDNYRARIIFPIKSATGSVLGFGARILNSQAKAPKYINSPENELYVKNRILYGLFEGRRAIGNENNCYLVEGYTDVISMHQAGVENVVASSGTSLTIGQLRLIKQLTTNITILYDGDSAGIAAALRGLNLALEEGFKVFIVPLEKGLDPDSFIAENGAEAFQNYIKEKQQDFILYRIQEGVKEGGGNPIRKSEIVNEIAESLSKIRKEEDFTLQSFYIKTVAEAFEVEEEGMVSLVNKFIRNDLNQAYREQERERQAEERAIRLGADENNEEESPLAVTSIEKKELKKVTSGEERMAFQLIKILLNYGEKPYKEATVAHHFYELISIDAIENAIAQKIAIMFYEKWVELGAFPKTNYFTSNEDEEIKSYAAKALLDTFTPSEEWTEKYKIDVHYGDAIYKQEVASTFAYFQLKTIRKYLEENNKLIQESARENSEDLLVYMQTHLDLKKQEKELMNVVIIR